MGEGKDTAGTQAEVGAGAVRVAAEPEGGAAVVREVDPRAAAQWPVSCHRLRSEIGDLDRCSWLSSQVPPRWSRQW